MWTSESIYLLQRNGSKRSFDLQDSHREKMKNVKNTQTSERIAWVDYTKAIAIIGIIVGHVAPWFSQVISWAHPLCELMYSFHVATFFLLSGYTTKRGLMSLRKIASFAKTCFLPFLIAGIFSIVVCMVFTPNKSIIEWLAALFYGAGAYNGELVWGYPFGKVVIGAIWFLPALFIGKLLATSMSKFPIVIRLLLSAVLFVAGMKTATMLFLPMDIQQGMCACWWITCGMILSQTKLFQGKKKTFLAITVSLAFLGLLYMSVLWMQVWQEPMYCNSTYHNGIFDMFGTTCATVIVIILAKCIEYFPNIVRRFFNWAGKNTLAIFCWHAVAISPGVFLSDWILSFATEEYPPTHVFFIALGAELGIAFGLTLISYKVPGLKNVFFSCNKSSQSTLLSNVVPVTPAKANASYELSSFVPETLQTRIVERKTHNVLSIILSEQENQINIMNIFHKQKRRGCHFEYEKKSRTSLACDKTERQSNKTRKA